MVFLQSQQHPHNKRIGLEELSFMATQEPDITDVRRECLNHCLRKLPVENRELIIEYYRKEGQQKIDHRVAMADRMGIPGTRYGVAPNASGTNWSDVSGGALKNIICDRNGNERLTEDKLQDSRYENCSERKFDPKISARRVI